ncbi:MAG: FISUMP domain-containing protein [Bacteroidales bacterium]|nr:FISUMP domain-containing protein [Bacteroidales bacterium]MDY6347791.1 FISUMP domain-containing protein [Bacteroidales bacterium]
MKEKYRCAFVWDNAKAYNGQLAFAGNLADSMYRNGSELGSELSIKLSSTARTDSMAVFYARLQEMMSSICPSFEVRDTIGGNFSLVMPADSLPFSITVGDSVLARVKVSDREWNFGEKRGDVWPYVVTYDPESSSFLWKSNIGLSIKDSLSIKYTLVVKSSVIDTLSDGDYPTNLRASLVVDSVSSDFEVPVVHFHVPQCDEAVDYEGNRYPAAVIAGKCWMTENLCSTKYFDGRDIEGVMQYESKLYPEDLVNNEVFGKLYTWKAAVDMDASGNIPLDNEGHVRGACPKGWYVPSDSDYAALYKIPIEELRSTEYWLHGAGTNASSFNMVRCLQGATTARQAAMRICS